MNRRRATRVMALAACLGLTPMLAVAQKRAIPRHDEARDGQAIRRVKGFRASRIDKDLPNVPFGRWVEQVLGPGLTWEMNDCGEGAGPICVEVHRKSPAVSISLIVGNHERGGISGVPALFFGTMKLFDIDREIRRLSDVGGFVQEARWRTAAFRNHPLKPITDADAFRIGRTVPAQVLDPLLPRDAFEKWLLAQLPQGVVLNWQHAPCGGNDTQPSCVFVIAKWPNGSTAMVSLNLESIQRGLNEQPAFREASFYDRVKMRNGSYRTLVAFAAAVRSASF
jgi:hypothetical protein